MFKQTKPRKLQIRLIASFVAFAVLLMAILWVLQVFALRGLYESMKTREIQRTADEIVASYSSLDIEKIRNLSARDDMLITLETEGGFVVYTGASDILRPSIFGGTEDTREVRRLLDESADGTVSYTTRIRGVTMLVCGRMIRDSLLGTVYLSVFSPLSPVDSTIDILSTQLIWVTVISLVLACLIAYFLAARLAKPLAKITESAEELKKGHYGVQFEGSGYEEAVRLADTLTQTSEELARTDELKKDLLANVSHDLRTPLTMIRSYAEMVRDLSGDNPEKRTEHLNVIIDESDRLNVIVSDLLTLSKMQAGMIPLETTSFNLAEEAENALRPFRILEQDGYVIAFRVGGTASASDFGGAYTVTADLARIRQVLANLLTNAFRYDTERKRIDVTVTALKDSVRCDVTDHGIGISKEDLEHIWDRYYRSSETAVRSQSGGSGLGLAITKEILELHNAEYGVDSTPGEGSTFWFALRK